MESLELSSRSYFLWNNDLGVEIAGLEADTLTPVASMTKMMTALLTLENCALDHEVTITSEMLQGLEEYAVIGLSVGQVVTVEDLLYATMLPSAGDAAQALAIEVGGSIAGFAEMMNVRAAEIGMTKTQFSNPVGMDEDNYSTPRDIAKLVEVALENPEFLTIFESFEREVPTIGTVATKTFRPQKYIKGGKTGYTEAAGRCLASTAEVEGTEYILVTVGAEPGENVVDAGRIYDFVAENYQPVEILRAGERILRLGVENSPVREMEFLAEQDVIAALGNEVQQGELRYSYDGVTKIERGAELGAKLGTYTIAQGEVVLYSQDIIYTEAPEFYNYGWVMAGAGVSGVLLLTTIGLAIKVRKKSKKTKVWPVVMAVLFVLSVLANFCLFRGWFLPAEEMEIYQPELRVQEAEGDVESEVEEEEEPEESGEVELGEQVTADSGNCTSGLGNLMLINPNFTVDTDFINGRKQQLVSVSGTYGIPEYNPGGNGDNLMIPEAAMHLNEMVAAYRQYNPGHEMGTYSCFRARGTQCGRLCAATGTSDHHTGLTCDLIDLAYGSELDSDDYAQHVEWQWLRANSYKYGFIDRFPEEWAGGPMTAPLNVDENGTTGLFETWHYRYVGVTAATEIATGKYNEGRYDSLEHYLKMTGRVQDLKNGLCKR